MKCARRDCAGAARWRPTLLLRTKNHGALPPTRIEVGLAVCDEHAQPCAELYITDDSWKHLLGMFDEAGKQRPHRSKTTVEYEDLRPEAGSAGIQ